MLEVLDNYEKHKLPIDALWTDIDYMFEYNDFTVDTSRFKLEDMKKIYNTSSKTGVHWVPIIDVGIGINSDAAK